MSLWWRCFSRSVVSCSLRPYDCGPPASSVHEIFRQEYWSVLPFPSPGDPPYPGIEPATPALADGFFTNRAILQLLKPIECTTAKVSPNSNLGLWVMMMSPCRFINHNRCSTQVRSLTGRVCACVACMRCICIFLSVLLWTLNSSKIIQWETLWGIYLFHIHVQRWCPQGDLPCLSISMKKLLLCCLESSLEAGRPGYVCLSLALLVPPWVSSKQRVWGQFEEIFLGAGLAYQVWPFLNQLSSLNKQYLSYHVSLVLSVK